MELEGLSHLARFCMEDVRFESTAQSEWLVGDWNRHGKAQAGTGEVFIGVPA